MARTIRAVWLGFTGNVFHTPYAASPIATTNRIGMRWEYLRRHAQSSWRGEIEKRLDITQLPTKHSAAPITVYVLSIGADTAHETGRK